MFIYYTKDLTQSRYFSDQQEEQSQDNQKVRQKSQGSCSVVDAFNGSRNIWFTCLKNFKQ